MIKNNFIITARHISLNAKKINYHSKNYKVMDIPYVWFLTDSIKTKNPEDTTRKLPFNSGILIRSYNIKNKEKIIKNIINLKKRKVHTVLVSGRHKTHSNVDGAHLPSWLSRHNEHCVFQPISQLGICRVDDLRSRTAAPSCRCRGRLAS